MEMFVMKSSFWYSACSAHHWMDINQCKMYWKWTFGVLYYLLIILGSPKQTQPGRSLAPPSPPPPSFLSFLRIYEILIGSHILLAAVYSELGNFIIIIKRACHWEDGAMCVRGSSLEIENVTHVLDSQLL